MNCFVADCSCCASVLISAPCGTGMEDIDATWGGAWIVDACKGDGMYAAGAAVSGASGVRVGLKQGVEQ